MDFAVSYECEVNISQPHDFLLSEGAPQPGSIDELTVLPDPLELHTGATVTISATLTLSGTVQPGSQVALSITKKFLGVDVPFPCLEIDGNNIGSW